MLKFFLLTVFGVLTTCLNLLGQSKDDSNAHALFMKSIGSLQSDQMKLLNSRERKTGRKISITLETGTSNSIYIGSNLKKNEIVVNQNMIRWLYNRAIVATLDHYPEFHRTGILDLYDRLFVYFDLNSDISEITKLSRSDVDRIADTSRYFKRNYHDYLSFIYFHELGHFIRHQKSDLEGNRNRLLDSLIRDNQEDTTSTATLKRMEDCFLYYQYEQGIEVEADAFAMGKVLANVSKALKGLSAQNIRYAFDIGMKIIEAFKYSKNGTILDLPKATCNALIRNQMLMYSRDSILIVNEFHDNKPEQKRMLLTMGKSSEDSIRSVANVLLDLCEKPGGSYEKELSILEQDSTFQFAGWEYHTAFILNYLARNSSNADRFLLAENKILKQLRFLEKGNFKSSFGPEFQDELIEYLYIILASVYEYGILDRNRALIYYTKAKASAKLLPSNFYESAILKMDRP